MWRNDRIVPVLLCHSIGPRRAGWAFAQLSESVSSVAGTLDALHSDGFQTVGLSELYDHMAGSRPLDRRSGVITFDDGYPDNWVHAVPLLRKYGMRATVYVTPEFVDDMDKVRPQSRAPGETTRNCDGFMSWSELAAAQTEGVLDVKSHAMTHTWWVIQRVRNHHQGDLRSRIRVGWRKRLHASGRQRTYQRGPV